MALMAAGVPISNPVAGVAMGLVKKGENYTILTDIQGMEDHLGDMDFKVTGTKDGITATQMDIKVDGLSYDVLAKALEQARQGRLHIMGEMMKCISEPREDYKPFVPRIKQLEMKESAQFLKLERYITEKSFLSLISVHLWKFFLVRRVFSMYLKSPGQRLRMSLMY